MKCLFRFVWVILACARLACWKLLTFAPSEHGPYSLALVWLIGSYFTVLARCTTQVLGHTSACASVWPVGSDLLTVSHFVTKLLGHLGFEPRTKGL